MTTDGKGNRTCGGVTPNDLLEMAARARKHAVYFWDDPFSERLEEFADELEALARRLAAG
jgi:hypothetical protein